MKLARRWQELVDAPPRKLENERRARTLHDRGYAAYYGHRGRRNSHAAAQLYRAAGELGLAVSWLNLGHCYSAGRGVTKSSQRAFECYERGARLGDRSAKRAVAGWLIDGRGVKREARVGLELLRRLGRVDGDALGELAWRHEHGVGVRKDIARSVRLLRQGVDAGFAACCNDLSAHLHNEVDTPRAQREALTLCRRAAEAGEAQACVNLARAYEWGDGVARDERAAARWLKRAVMCDEPGEFGCEDAYRLLARRYLDGRGVKRSVREARRLLVRASNTGSERARRKLRELDRRPAR